MQDLNVRYEISYCHGQAHPGGIHKQHIKLLIALTSAFDKLLLQIYDNKNNRVKSFAEKKWMDKDYCDEHFTLHIEPRQRKTLIVH